MRGLFRSIVAPQRFPLLDLDTVLPWQFFAALLLFVVTYLLLVEATKKVFYSEPNHVPGLPHRTRGRAHRIQRRAARFSLVGRMARPAVRRRATA